MEEKNNKIIIEELPNIDTLFEVLKKDSSENDISLLQSSLPKIYPTIIDSRVFLLESEVFGNIGYIFLTEKDNILLLDLLFIKPKFQSKGFGKAIILQLSEIFKNKGYDKIQLESNPITSLGFWEKQGFIKYKDNSKGLWLEKNISHR